MRKFARSHWKILIAILLAVALATLTLETDSAPAPGAGPELSERLRAQVAAIAGKETGTAGSREPLASHIEKTLQGYGYRLRHQEQRAGGRQLPNIEASVSNIAAGARPERIFIVGAHYDPAQGARGAGDKAAGTAAVLELARLLKSMRPSRGTEVKFVFFVNGDAPWSRGEEMGSMRRARESARDEKPAPQPAGWYAQTQNSHALPPELEKQYPATGNFIAYVGTLESSALVRQALAAFSAQSDFPSEGLAAPAHVMGLTLSDHASPKRPGYPALMITDTAFLRYPYYNTAGTVPDKLDYSGMARVVKGLARTLDSLAGATRI